jgi:hypothetical protein
MVNYMSVLNSNLILKSFAERLQIVKEIQAEPASTRRKKDEKVKPVVYAALALGAIAAGAFVVHKTGLLSSTPAPPPPGGSQTTTNSPTKNSPNSLITRIFYNTLDPNGWANLFVKGIDTIVSAVVNAQNSLTAYLSLVTSYFKDWLAGSPKGTQVPTWILNGGNTSTLPLYFILTPHFGSKPIFGGTAIESQFENRSQPGYVGAFESVVQRIADSVYNIGQSCAATGQELIDKAMTDYSKAPVVGAAIGALRSLAQRLVSLHSIAMKDSIELTKNIRVGDCLGLRISVPIRKIFVKDLNLRRLNADDMIRITKYKQVLATGLLSTATLVATLYGATLGAVAFSLAIAPIVGYGFYSAHDSGGLTATAQGGFPTRGRSWTATGQEIIDQVLTSCSIAPVVVGAATGSVLSLGQRLVSLHSTAMKTFIGLFEKLTPDPESLLAKMGAFSVTNARDVFVRDLNLRRLNADDRLRITKYKEIIITGLLSTATLTATVFGATLGAVAFSLGCHSWRWNLLRSLFWRPQW